LLVDGTDEPECWQLVPVTFEDMCDWAYVSTNNISPDQTRRHLVLYRGLDMTEESVVYPVMFRVQGFIEHAKLTALGDWNGCIHILSYFYTHDLIDAQEFHVGNECDAISDVDVRRAY
jgi:hypothetical protein